jgi:hypothetical protein
MIFKASYSCLYAPSLILVNLWTFKFKFNWLYVPFKHHDFLWQFCSVTLSAVL